MVSIRTPEEIEIMKASGKIASSALKEILKNVRVGVTTLELNGIAEEFITSRGGEASFRTVEDYPFATCINTNDGIVHGMPNEYELMKGDVVSIDLGVLYDGFHSDLSYTVEVETQNEQKFLSVGKEALQKAIKACRVGKRLGDISHAMQQHVESHGYSVSRDLVGHGIGRSLHEDPFVPCFGQKNTGMKLKEGMVFAIEVIYQKGAPDLALEQDEWTLSTADGSLSGLFEKTVAISKEGPVQITQY